MTNTRDAIAAEVRAELGRKKVSQRQLAAKIGLSQAQISERMTSQTDFRVGELLAIADVLGVPVAQFLPTPATTATP